ncbi:MAG TPA: GNAT family N-acetyltransferase [Burkholderiales bacterium]|nr:GNAT family N-acetyltransferase [Burkholderiales bacterium]
MANIVHATQAGELAAVRALFAEYARAVNAPCCFAGLERELATLPGEYAPPTGRLLLALDASGSAGCVALRPLDPDTVEMKRLYVRPAYRGQGLGRSLAVAAIAAARKSGRRRVVLDTLPSMEQAIALYRSLDFAESAPYLPMPTPGAVCYQLKL